jgi:signal transduction histidine kinase
MKRIKIYILIFCLALSIPLSFVVWRTYVGVAREERDQLRFFAETLFDQMEAELSDLVQREENRAVNEYSSTLVSEDNSYRPSPLAKRPSENYILGYLQNNPDGTFQTPLTAGPQTLIERLREANHIFNQKKYTFPAAAQPAHPAPPMAGQAPARNAFAERYLAAPPAISAKSALGQKKIRVEEITPRQAANLSQDDISSSAEGPVGGSGTGRIERRQSKEAVDAAMQARKPATPSVSSGPAAADKDQAPRDRRFQVEVAPLQSVFIDADQVFVFRRVAIGNQIFRQGFILLMRPFLRHLIQAHFTSQPMYGFTHLSLIIHNLGGRDEVLGAGAALTAAGGAPIAERTFPAPFQFLSTALRTDNVPASAARRTLHVALAALGMVVLLGLAAIYQSVRSVVDLSERRSRFVSAVTHELKTPLTNIRMYAEMLEQGMAATPEREQVYLGIIGSESARLSRLINNVLELSRLEQKQRSVHLQPGRLEEVFAEVHSIMAPKLEQDHFELILPAGPMPECRYDREAMVQVLINLIENSIKFGHDAPLRRITIAVDVRDAWVYIAVTDTGPGIPQHALKHVFDDFYRADDALTRTTGGTGIGLALVKKLAEAMGGRVRAANHKDGPGCTFTLSLPLTAGE